MFEYKDFGAFKQHLRDFLVQVPADLAFLHTPATQACYMCTAVSWQLHTLSSDNKHRANTEWTRRAILRRGLLGVMQTKQFADKDNADLFAEEAAAQREVTQSPRDAANAVAGSSMWDRCAVWCCHSAIWQAHAI